MYTSSAKNRFIESLEINMKKKRSNDRLDFWGEIISIFSKRKAG